MSFLARLFKPKPPPATIQHPMLGEMVGFRAPNGNVGSWKTSLPIDTAIGKLNVHVKAGAAGPSSQQSEFLREILSKIEALRIEAYPFLAGWLEHLEPETRPEELTPNRMYIWEDSEADQEWSLMFLHPARHWEFTVTFLGLKAEHTDFDRLG